MKKKEFTRKTLQGSVEGPNDIDEHENCFVGFCLFARLGFLFFGLFGFRFFGFFFVAWF